jgi:hypothetical protein
MSFFLFFMTRKNSDLFHLVWVYKFRFCIFDWILGPVFKFFPSQVLDLGSKFFPSQIPDPGSAFFPSWILDPWSSSKNLSILTQKMVSKLSEIWSGFFIPDTDPGSWLFIHPRSQSWIPDPGSSVQKGTGSQITDPGSGSATLEISDLLWLNGVVSVTEIQWALLS